MWARESPMSGGPSRLLVTGDWHEEGSWARACCAIAQRNGCDGILQLGDLGVGDWGIKGRGERYLRVLERRVSEAELAGLWFVGGNHDDRAWLAGRRADAAGADLVPLAERIFWLANGARWVWQGVTFAALGGAYTLDNRWRTPGVDWWPGDGPDGEEPSPAEVELLGEEPLDVLVCHDAPLGAVPGDQRGDSAGQVRDAGASRTRSLITEAVERLGPSLVFHGHWHLKTSSVMVTQAGRRVMVEGLASNVERDHRSWGVLDLDPLRWHCAQAAGIDARPGR